MLRLARAFSLFLLVAFAANTAVQASQYAQMTMGADAQSDATMGVGHMSPGMAMPECKHCQAGAAHAAYSCDGYCVPQSIASLPVDIVFRSPIRLMHDTFPLWVPEGAERTPSPPPPQTI